jgi:hypothetical protein
VKQRSARVLLAAAVALYVSWVGALIAMAVLSATRPADANSRPVRALSRADRALLEKNLESPPPSEAAAPLTQGLTR